METAIAEQSTATATTYSVKFMFIRGTIFATALVGVILGGIIANS